MEFRDLKRQYQAHRQAIDDAMQEVIRGTHFIENGWRRLRGSNTVLPAVTGRMRCSWRLWHGK